MKIKPFFAWYDIWIGFYWDRYMRTLYFCPVPMLGIMFSFPKLKPRQSDYDWAEEKIKEVLGGDR